MKPNNLTTFLKNKLNSNQSPTIVGDWITFDDESHIKTYQITISIIENKYVGVVSKYFGNKNDTQLSPEINTLEYLWGVTQNNDGTFTGFAQDPETTMVYKVSIAMINNNRLKVDAHIGSTAHKRTQIWNRSIS